MTEAQFYLRALSGDVIVSLYRDYLAKEKSMAKKKPKRKPKSKRWPKY